VLSAALTLSLLAGGASIRVPPWPLSPDGDQVAVLGDAPLLAEGARVEREAGSLWRVIPEPGRDAVLLRSGEDSVRAPVAGPPGRILVTADPAAPVKGRDHEVRLRLEARGAAGEPLALAAAPHVVVSTGALGPIVAGAAPGSFEATWRPADSPQPEVLGIVALAPRCPLCATPLAVGVAHLPVAAAIDLPGRSDPGVQTRVEIAGRSWGPVRADDEGRFRVPAIVPPGARWGLATSLSALGNERRTKLDLHLSDSPGFHCALWPERVPADGRAEAGLFCVAWTAAGGRADPARLRATAARGALSDQRVDEELWSVRYRSPAGGARADPISVSWTPVAEAKAQLSVGLAAGAPASIEWIPEGEPAVPGSSVHVTARALDAQGEALGDASATDRSLEGGLLRVRRELGDGRQRLTLTWAPPAGGSAARLSLHRERAAWVAVVRDVDARPVAGVAVRFGGGQRGVTDARGEARIGAKGPAETVEGPSGLRAIAWEGATTPAPALSVTRDVELALRPPGSVDVAASLEGGWIRWKVRAPDGAALPGRAVSAESDTVRLGPVEVDGEGGRCAVRGGKGTVAVIDAESGVAAILEVR
jgi:hypothetical protein